MSPSIPKSSLPGLWRRRPADCTVPLRMSRDDTAIIAKSDGMTAVRHLCKAEYTAAPTVSAAKMHITAAPESITGVRNPLAFFINITQSIILLEG